MAFWSELPTSRVRNGRNKPTQVFVKQLQGGTQFSGFQEWRDEDLFVWGGKSGVAS